MYCKRRHERATGVTKKLSLSHFTRQMFQPPEKSLKEVKAKLLVLIRLPNITLQTLLIQLKVLLITMKRLKQTGPSPEHITKRNLITASLLKLEFRISKASADEDTHETYQLWVNCLRYNYEHFIAQQGRIYHLRSIEQYMFDLIWVNSTLQVYPPTEKPAWIVHVQDHRMLNELTRSEDKFRVNDSVYYLIQLILILVTKDASETINTWLKTSRIKIQSFLLLYNDPKLVSVFLGKVIEMKRTFSSEE